MKINYRPLSETDPGLFEYAGHMIDGTAPKTVFGGLPREPVCLSHKDLKARAKKLWEPGHRKITKKNAWRARFALALKEIGDPFVPEALTRSSAFFDEDEFGQSLMYNCLVHTPYNSMYQLLSTMMKLDPLRAMAAAKKVSILAFALQEQLREREWRADGINAESGARLLPRYVYIDVSLKQNLRLDHLPEEDDDLGDDDDPFAGLFDDDPDPSDLVEPVRDPWSGYAIPA